MIKKLISFCKDEEGATMVEYALMVALIAVALIGTVGLLKDGIGHSFTKATTELNK
jgi:pilus assembly protein Flp/PilA